jgi:hypothetical protein
MGKKVIQGINTFQHNCTKKRGKNNMGNIVIQGNIIVHRQLFLFLESH